MQLLKNFLAIILVQIITAIMVSMTSVNPTQGELIRLAIPLIFISLIVAFWLMSLSAHSRKNSEEKLKHTFTKEKEKIQMSAEKEKMKVVKEAQQDIAREAKVTYAKANFKVGAAFAGTIAIGALFVFAQMVTVGLLAITAAGGAAGGYYYRGKRPENKRHKELPIIDVKVIEK
ncbi:MAG TPA: hypothetical protein EYM49_02315 [Campylobacterales bacterium]|nr:hypothetical protein [Campylobacterales bacterium]